ncbi:MAG: tRNA (guanosine(37)-N1)-methyltransferase TrmD [Candidatus Pacebacteria bacterium]|nr:tRNA (guanosine(37)-N1)-methyltransferase TrmD [Candidatus Paceibacterota bacterium]
MKFNIITIFPEMFDSYLNESILARAIKAKKIGVKFFNPRDFTRDKHKKVDERPYAGGPGMVMTAEPILRAVAAASRKKLPASKGKSFFPASRPRVIIFSPGGKTFTNEVAKRLVKSKQDLILIAGRYEGIDGRVKKILKAEEYSVGPYILTGGELPAMIMIDAIARQIPGVLGKEESLEDKRVSSHEVYTRPEILEWQGKKYRVPPILLSGDPKKIDEWKKKKRQ